MRRVLLALLSIVFIAGIISTFVTWLIPKEPVLPLDEVTVGLQRQPSMWVGRTLLVRATVATLQTSSSPGQPWIKQGDDLLRPHKGIDTRIGLISATLQPNSQVIQRAFAPGGLGLIVQPNLPPLHPDPVSDTIRHIPFIGQIVPSSKQWIVGSRGKRWYNASVYRLTLLPRLNPNDPSCVAYVRCVDALLDDLN